VSVWRVEERGPDQRWRTVHTGALFSAVRHVHADAISDGRDVRLVRNGTVIRMRATSEQLDLDNEDD
jgi:hypothetical protein